MVRKSNSSELKDGQPKQKRVCLAMSGGVDSSAAAVLLKEQGYEVVGVFMKFWKPVGIFANCQPWENNCCSEESETIARLVANKLGIAFYVVDFQREFKRAVVDYFLKELKSGRTPNPCIVCNQEIKFGLLFKKAMALGADYLATGHYTRNQKSKIPPSPPAGGFGGQASPVGGQASPVGGQAKIKSRGWGGEIIYKLLRAKDANKDQSYFLWTLKQKQLKHLLFPLGGYTKSQAREIVAKLKLPIAPKESFDIGFRNPCRHRRRSNRRSLHRRRPAAPSRRRRRAT